MSYYDEKNTGGYRPQSTAPQSPPPRPGVQPGAQPQAPYPYQAQQPGYHTQPGYQAHYQTPHSLRYDPAPTPPPKKNRTGAKILGGTALVLACALAGFGGSAAAMYYVGGGESRPVIYRSAEEGGSASGVATGADKTISDIAQSSAQSVVAIDTEVTMNTMFGGAQTAQGAGSGVVISADGTILTNHHVIDGAESIKVTLPDGNQYDARLVGSDSATDVAVLKIEASGLVPAVLADSDGIQVGDFCIAIGNPTGTLSGTVTDGIVSALNREINIQGTPMSLLQMSAPVSPGNSGGGLFNANGELMGLVNAKSGASGSEGLGFAIPINTAMQVAEEILAHGYVTGRPMLGVGVREFATAEEAALAGVGEPGLYVLNVTPGSGAEQAGLQVGDRIVRFADAEISTHAELSQALGAHSPGDEVSVGIVRGGQQLELKVTLQEKTPEQQK